jgi:TP901 family phage tail tape measure protein
MASGAVRELITKIKFQIDKASESKVKSTMQEIKRQLNNFAKNPTKAKINVDTTRATTALQSIKTQLNSLQGKTVTTYVQTKQKGASAAAKGGGNGGNALADNAGVLAATGAAMVAPLALPISTAMDFEQAMSKVKAITNSTDEDMARLTATARELGASTQYSATEAAQAMAYLGMAGWKTEEIIKGMPGLLDLAAASGEDLARVSDIVSDDLTAFRMSADQASHMADVMAAASTNANTNVSMMGETFKYTGAVAGALGYSLEDVAAAAGLMANAGIKSEMAGTALRSIMTRMIKPPKEAAAALDQLGVSATNADGTVKPFREQLIALRNAMKGLTDAQKAEMANSIAGQEAMSGFLAVVNASDEDFAKMTNAVDNSNGASKKMANTMNNNAKGAMKEFKSSVEEVEIIVGNAFLKAITSATKAVTKFVKAFGEFAKEHPQLVGGIMVAVAAIGALLVALGGVGLAVSAISTAFEALAPIFTAVGGALSVGLAPILAILAAIASVILFVGENWDLVVSWFSPALDSMLEGLESLRGAWEAIQPLIVALTPLIQFLATLIGEVIVGALSLMYRWWAFIFNQIAGLIEWIAGKLGGLGSIIQTLAGGLSGLIDKAAQFIGMEGQIQGVNTDLTQRIADAAIANGTTVNNSQTNYNTFTEPNQWGATNAGNGQFFAIGEYR